MARLIFPKWLNPGRIGRPLAQIAAAGVIGLLSPLPGLPQTQALRVVDRPIHFDAEREALTLAYRRAHSDPSATDIEISPRIVVIHHTAFAHLEEAWRYFDRARIEAGRKKIARAGLVNVSAHYLVDRNGTVYRLMPETKMARHCIGLNHIAIGIENVGGTKDTPLTDAQLAANEALVRDIARRRSLSHLIGHHEYRALEGQPEFRERDTKYRTTKIDPGPVFMTKLRARLADLHLRDAQSHAIRR